MLTDTIFVYSANSTISADVPMAVYKRKQIYMQHVQVFVTDKNTFDIAVS